MLAEALKGVPRERYTLVTNFRHPEEQDPAKMVERFLKELKTDYLDAVLAGAILTKDWATESKWAERRDLLSAAKQAGRIKAHGVSVHGFEALQSLPADPWVELALVSCNHKGTWMDAPAGKQATEIERRDLSVPLIHNIHAAGIGTAGMKIFSHSGYRDSSNPAEERSNAIRYVMSLGSIDTLPIMCESIHEFEEVRGIINGVGQI
jgi:aryl-alcohol dehydrogenase-like predicted oxidoreductase